MTKKLCLGLAVILLMTSGLLANGLNLNGFGARATAMGGAFVGLADDFTAVFWNPAGLALMKKGTFGLAGHLLLPTSDYTSLTGFNMKTNAKMYPAGIVGFFQPIGDRLVVGVGAYSLSGLGQDWNNTGLEADMLTQMSAPPPSAFTPPVANYRWKSFIGSITIAPAIAVKLTDQVLLGATFNINYGFFKTDQWAGPEVIYNPITKQYLFFNLGQASMNIKGWGYGATFGLLVKPSDRFSFGVTYRLASKMKLSGTATTENLPLLSAALPDTSDAKMSVTSPMWLAGGLAVKPLTNLTVTFDLQWTNWKKLDVLSVEFQDPAWIAAGITTNELDLAWANKLQIRGGLEYKMGDFALRAGYYNDPAPAPASTMNILIPGFTYNSVACGFGYTTGGLHLDLGLEYLMGHKRTIADITAEMPGIYTMKILVPIVSVSYGW
jgi:long-chain fatty acid transport protein